jgi:hypothetical protein
VLPLQVLRCSLSRRSTAKLAPTDILREVLPPRGYSVREPLTTINIFATRMSVTSSREQAGPSCRELRVMRSSDMQFEDPSCDVFYRGTRPKHGGAFLHMRSLPDWAFLVSISSPHSFELLTLEMNRSAIARMVSSKVSKYLSTLLLE